MLLRLTVTFGLGIALALAPSAGAATTGVSGPLTTLPSTVPATTTPASTSSAPTGPVTVPVPAAPASSSGGVSSGEAIGIGVVVLLILAGIGRFIVTDARSHQPSRATRELDRARGTVKPIEHRISQSRAKAKRAKRARRAGR